MVITPAFFEGIRQALLLMVDTIERELGISPRTSELRKQFKAELRKQAGDIIQQEKESSANEPGREKPTDNRPDHI